MKRLCRLAGARGRQTWKPSAHPSASLRAGALGSGLPRLWRFLNNGHNKKIAETSLLLERRIGGHRIGFRLAEFDDPHAGMYVVHVDQTLIRKRTPRKG